MCPTWEDTLPFLSMVMVLAEPTVPMVICGGLVCASVYVSNTLRTLTPICSSVSAVPMPQHPVSLSHVVGQALECEK